MKHSFLAVLIPALLCSTAMAAPANKFTCDHALVYQGKASAKGIDYSLMDDGGITAVTPFKINVEYSQITIQQRQQKAVYYKDYDTYRTEQGDTAVNFDPMRQNLTLLGAAENTPYKVVYMCHK